MKNQCTMVVMGQFSICILLSNRYLFSAVRFHTASKLKTILVDFQILRLLAAMV